MPIAAIEVQVDAANTLALLHNGGKRMAYAVVNAINTTAKAIQTAERARVRSEFIVRKSEFISRQVAVIKPFASVGLGRYEARISVGQKDRLLLSKFEEGGTRGPFTPGAQHVAVPVEGGARPTATSEVPADMFVRALGLKRQRAKSAAQRAKRAAAVLTKGRVNDPIVGERGTYVVPGAGIYQHVAGSRLGRVLYAFAKGAIRLRPELHFIDTGKRIAAAVLEKALAAEVHAAWSYQLRSLLGAA